MSLHLHLYFVITSNEGSGEPAHLCRNEQTSEPALINNALDNALNTKISYAGLCVIPGNARKMAMWVPRLPRAKFYLLEEERCDSVVVCLT